MLDEIVEKIYEDILKYNHKLIDSEQMKLSINSNIALCLNDLINKFTNQINQSTKRIYELEKNIIPKLNSLWNIYKKDAPQKFKYPKNKSEHPKLLRTRIYYWKDTRENLIIPLWEIIKELRGV